MDAEQKIDPLSAEAHNSWVDDLLEEIEFGPLRDFIGRLKEPAVRLDNPPESDTK